MLLANKTAVIYGATGATGSVVARAFAREGAQVFVTGRDLKAVDALAKQIVAAGGAAEAAKVDAHDERAVEEHRVFEQLLRERPAGIRYASFKRDGVGFVHVVSVERADDRNPLTELSAFRAFTAGIRERCEDLPVTTELKEIGPYGFFSA